MIGAFADLFFILFLGGFLATAPTSYRRGVTRLFPKDQRERADQVLRDLYRTLQGLLLAFGEGPTLVIWIALLYLVVQLLEGNVIFPIAEAKTVHLPPAITLVAVFVGGALFGLIGFLVATPLTAVIYVLVKRLYVQDTLGYDVALENQE